MDKAKYHESRKMENIEIGLNILYLSYSPHLGLHNMHDKLNTCLI